MVERGVGSGPGRYRLPKSHQNASFHPKGERRMRQPSLPIDGVNEEKTEKDSSKKKKNEKGDRSRATEGKKEERANGPAANQIRMADRA